MFNLYVYMDTRVGMGIRKYLVDVCVVACWLHCTCKNDIHRLSGVSTLYIM